MMATKIGMTVTRLHELDAEIITQQIASGGWDTKLSTPQREHYITVTWSLAGAMKAHLDALLQADELYDRYIRQLTAEGIA